MKRRRWIWRISWAAFLLVTLVGLLHTAPVRRAVFILLCDHLDRSQGIRVRSLSFDYNLLTPRFVFDGVTLLFPASDGIHPRLTAERIHCRLRYRDLIRGSLKLHSLELMRPRLEVVRMSGDASQDQTRMESHVTDRMRLPVDAIHVVDLSLSFYDARTGLRIQLPRATLEGRTNSSTGDQEIDCDLLSPGVLSWNSRVIPIEGLGFSILVRDGTIALRNLFGETSGITVKARGVLQQPDSPRMFVDAEAVLEGAKLSRLLGFQDRLAGTVHAGFRISGDRKQPVLDAQLRSEELNFGPFRGDSLEAKARFDSSTGVLEIRQFSAATCEGRVRVRGIVSPAPRRSNLQVEGEGLTLGRLAASLGWRSAPGGSAAVGLDISWPGLQWGQMTATARVAIETRQGPANTISGHLTGYARNGHVQISVDSIAGYGATLRGLLEIGIQDQSIAGELNGEIESLSRLIDSHRRDTGKGAGLLPTLQGSARWRMLLSGSVRDPRISAYLEGTSLGVGRLAGANLDLRADYASDRVLIREARLNWRGQTAAASGEIGLLSPNDSLRIEAVAEGAEIAEILRGLNFDADVQGITTVRLTAAGRRDDPHVNILLEADGIAAYGEPLGSLTAEAQYGLGRVVLSEFKLDKPQPGGNGTLEAQGSVRLDSREYQFSLSGNDWKFTTLPLPGRLSAAARLHVKGVGKGTLDNPSIDLESTWRDLQVAGSNLGTLHADLVLDDHTATLSVENPGLGLVAGVRMTTRGAYPFGFDLTLNQHNRTVGTPFGLPVTITSAATAKGRGTLFPVDVLEASAQLTGVHFEIKDTRIRTEGNVDLRYADRRFFLAPVKFSWDESNVEVAGHMPLLQADVPGRISVTGIVGLHSIASLFHGNTAADVHGSAQLDAEIRGSLESPDPIVTVTVRDGHVHSAAFAVDNLEAIARLGNRRISVDSLNVTIGEGTVVASADVPLDFVAGTFRSRGPGTLVPARFSVAAVNAPIRLSGKPGIPVVLFSGKLTGESDRPDMEALTARLDLSDVSVRHDSFSMKQSKPATFTIAGGRLQINQWRWAGAPGELQITGSVGLTGDHLMDLHILGKADAGLCSLLSPSASGKGLLSMDLTVFGAPRDPVLSGVLETHKAAFSIPQPRLRIEDLDLVLELDRGRVQIRTMEGLLNGGRIRGSGGALLQGKGLADLKFDLSGSDVFLEFPDGVKSSSNLSLQARDGESGIVVGGEVEIREASYLESFDFSGKETREPSGGAPRGGKAHAPGSRIRCDIRIRTLQPIEINNNLARLSARADIRVVGEPWSPGLLGTITIDRGGRVYFGGRVYYTERGVVTFTNEARIEPLYDFVATTQVNDYQVSLRLSQSGSEISVTFTSDPPLSQNDIVALLLTGKPLSESGGGRVDPVQAERLSLLTGALNADLSARMRRRFGISQVMIQPSLISEESDPGARLTIGQDLNQSLRFVYSMNLVNSADQVWYLEYDLKRRLTTRAVMQSDNTYRADFRHDLRLGGRRPASSDAAGYSRKLRVGKVEFTGVPLFSPAVLAREFRISTGDSFDFQKSRRGIERLLQLYGRQDHLTARVYLDREEEEDRVDLTVKIESGKKVKLRYAGAKVPESVDRQVRRIWQEGIADRQRIEDAEGELRAHFAQRGYPHVNVNAAIDEAADQKAVVFEVRTGTRYKHVRTVFEGAGPDHLASILKRLDRLGIADTAWSRPASIVDEVGSYYRQKGYYLAKIHMPRLDVDEGRRTASLTFKIEEGPQIRVRALKLKGNESVAADELRKFLPLREGSVLDPDQLRKAASALAEKYGALGYRNPEIASEIALDEDNGCVDVTFAIREGVTSVIRSLTVDGEDRVSEKFIRDQLRIAAGEPQNVPETNRSIRNLYNTGAFARVDIESAPQRTSSPVGGDAEKVDVTVRVQEVAPFKILYGGYYDSGGGPGVISEFENRNSLGAARVFGLRTRYDSDLQEARIYFSQPLWRRRPRTTTGTLYFRRETDYYEGLSAERVGFTLQQEITFQRKLVASLGYRLESVVSWYPDRLAPDPPPAIVAPLTLSLTRSTRNDFLDPTSGSFASVAMEYGPEGLGSTYGYTRVFGQYFKYFPLREPGYVPLQDETKRPRVVYATGIRLGMIKGLTADQVIPTERFYAGGGTTVRGFKQNTLGPLDQSGDPLGGNAMLVLNNELRFPIFSIFDGVGFLDVGNVFPLVTDFRLSELRKTAGFGIRLRTPSLMFRFDYGFKLDRHPGESKGAFFVSIGQAY
jgi:outer membrane protein assembly complex protein YaeT